MARIQIICLTGIVVDSVIDRGEGAASTRPVLEQYLTIKCQRAGLIIRRKHGRQRICHVVPQMLHSATEWLEYYQTFWENKLENLEQFVESE